MKLSVWLVTRLQVRISTETVNERVFPIEMIFFSIFFSCKIFFYFNKYLEWKKNNNNNSTCIIIIF